MVEHPDQRRRGCGSGSETPDHNLSILGRLDPEGNTLAIRAEGVRVRTIEVDYHARDGRIRAIQTHAHAANTVRVQGKMFLFCVGKSTGKHKYKPVWVDCRLDCRRYRAGQDHLDRNVRALALDLQLLDLSRAACCALRSPQRSQEKEHK